MATAERFNLAKWGLDRWQVVGIVLGTLGVADTVYLTYTKLTGGSLYCGEHGGCNTVLGSDASMTFGVPISLFGLLAYLTLTVLFAAEARLAVLQAWGPYLAFGVTLVGILFSGYLTWLQFGPIGTYCYYCLASAVTMTLLFVISLVRLRRAFLA